MRLDAFCKRCRSSVNTSVERKTPLVRLCQFPRVSPVLWEYLLSFFVPIALFVALFFPSFSSNARFSYRDVAFYYYPLFQQIQNCWESGNVPLWTPFVNLGQPLAADPTASVFYPIKLIFFLSSLGCVSYATCFKLYVWIHVVVAFALSYRLSRNLKISHTGSLFGALTYAFSGHILFQYTNVVYLVGAAWTPGFFSLALSFYREVFFRKRVKILIKLGVLLSLAILGGEPQIVYLTIVTLTIIFLFVPIKHGIFPNRLSRSSLVKTSFRQRVISVCVFTAFVSTIAFSLAAIQILPSLEIVANSQRQSEQPRSIWEIPQKYRLAHDSKEQKDTLSNDFFSNLLCADFSSGGHSCSTYRFSVGPWRWLEFVFPNIGGRQFPQSSRWFNVLPEEASVWTPSLYFGVFPFLLAFSAIRFRFNRIKDNSFQIIGTWLVLISLLASMGGFGQVWICRILGEFLSNRQITTFFSNYDPIGGVYWLLNVALPYFSNFRYPAKFLTLTMLGFSCLTGFGWDCKSYSVRLRNSLFLIVLTAFFCLIIVSATGDDLFSKIRSTDPLFGSFQPALAQHDVCRSFLQTVIVLLISSAICLSLRLKRIRRSPRSVQCLSLCLLAVTATDVYLANSWTIVVSPTSLYKRESVFLKQIEKEQKDMLHILQPKIQNNNSPISKEFNATPPTRVYRFPVWFPPIFQTETSKERNSERIIWDVETLFPLYPFDHNIALLDVRGAVSENYYSNFIDATLNSANIGETLGFLGVDYVIGPKFWVANLLSANPKPTTLLEGLFSAQLDCSVTMDHVQFPITRAALYQSEEQVALSGKRSTSRDDAPLPLQENDDCVEILSYEPNSIVYLVSTKDPSDIVFAEQFWPDWFATSIAISKSQAKILQNNRFNSKVIQATIKNFEKDSPIKSTVKPTERTLKFLRKTSVPEGLWCVKVDYRPKKLILGAIVSLISWGALVVFSILRLFRRQKNVNQKLRTNPRLHGDLLQIPHERQDAGSRNEPRQKLDRQFD